MLLEVSETISWPKLWCFYSFIMLQHWVGGRGLIYFHKVNHSRTSINFSRNLLDLNNLRKILYIIFTKCLMFKFPQELQNGLRQRILDEETLGKSQIWVLVVPSLPYGNLKLATASKNVTKSAIKLLLKVLLYSIS